MAVEISITTTVLPGGKIELISPEFIAGQQATIHITLEEAHTPVSNPNIEQPSPINRRAFMQLPLAERRRLLSEQADILAADYDQDPDWQQLQADDFVDY